MTLEAGFSHPGELWASDSCGVRAKDSGSGLASRGTAQQVHRPEAGRLFFSETGVRD